MSVCIVFKEFLGGGVEVLSSFSLSNFRYLEMCGIMHV